MALMAGCAALFSVGCGAIPAIDPTGEHLFSGTTSLVHHDLASCSGLHGRTQPAPVNPPCAPPVIVGPIVPSPPVVAIPAPPPIAVVPVMPVSCGQKQVPQQMPLPPRMQIVRPGCDSAANGPNGPILKVTPSRIVAPICSEVVLVAGLCGERGYYVTRQPLEWMITQDGVGQIVVVGQESPLNVSYLLTHSPQKEAPNFARARTSTISQVIDRGTPTPVDDVYLEKGQSWISVTSPTEGTSHVVVVAPREENWEQRKTTATIYWVDAAWAFPPPVAARAGQPQTLTTTVTRSGGAPVAGWIVRYDVLEGPPASFSARGETSIEVRTNASGQATAQLLPRSADPGITTVRVQVIRPAAARGDLTQMVVGQGQTAVSWSSPGLQVTASGPATVAADGAISYRVNVTNNGDLPTRGVTLRYTPPAGVSLLNSTPAAQAFGQRYEWRIGDLPARATSVVQLNCRAAVAADVVSCFRAESAERVTAEGCARTRVQANYLSVKMTGPDAVEVGKEAKFLVEITNTGPGTLTRIVASDTYDPGLQERYGAPSPVVRAIDQPVLAGETYRMAVTFLVTQPGRHCHRLDVTAEGGHTASARGCVTGIAAAPTPPPAATPPQLSVRVTGPPTKMAGEIAEYAVDVTNAGSTAATNVLIRVEYGVNLELVEATRDHQDDLRRRTTQWQVAQIGPGETVRKRLNCRCLNPDENALVRATVTSSQIGTQTATARTVITPGASAPMSRSPVERPMDPPVAGSLKITVRDLADPIRLGESATYLITVTNERAAPDRDVALTLELTPGLRFKRSSGPTDVAAFGAQNRVVEITPVAEARPGEILEYRVEVTGSAAGKQRLRATARSSRSPAGVSAEAETTVNMP